MRHGRNLLREGYLKGLRDAKRVIESIIDGSDESISLDTVVEYAKEAAKGLIECIEDDPDGYSPSSGGIEDELKVKTTDDIEACEHISLASDGVELYWYTRMWDNPILKKLVKKFVDDAYDAGYDSAFRDRMWGGRA